jgi:hypothetical protein
MDINRYENITSSVDYETFSFVSTGPKGDFIKIVNFIALQNIPGAYNLALGTVRGKIVDYNETTNNGDRNQILATIFYIARVYSGEYPDRRIFIAGRNEATTRLYRGAINHGYVEFTSEFKVYGGIYILDEDRYNFEQFIADRQYDAFLFERR